MTKNVIARMHVENPQAPAADLDCCVEIGDVDKESGIDGSSDVVFYAYPIESPTPDDRPIWSMRLDYREARRLAADLLAAVADVPDE